MKKSSYPGVAIAFSVSAIAIGISYWRLPYSQLALPNSLFGIGTFVTLVIGIAIRATGITEFRETIFTIGAVFVAVVLIRIAADVMMDPTTHNLWPFEVIIASIVGLLVGAIAAGFGSLVHSLRVRKDSG